MKKINKIIFSLTLLLVLSLTSVTSVMAACSRCNQNAAVNTYCGKSYIAPNNGYFSCNYTIVNSIKCTTCVKEGISVCTSIATHSPKVEMYSTSGTCTYCALYTAVYSSHRHESAHLTNCSGTNGCKF